MEQGAIRPDPQRISAAARADRVELRKRGLDVNIVTFIMGTGPYRGPSYHNNEDPRPGPSAAGRRNRILFLLVHGKP